MKVCKFVRIISFHPHAEGNEVNSKVEAASRTCATGVRDGGAPLYLVHLPFDGQGLFTSWTAAVFEEELPPRMNRLRMYSRCQP